MKEDECYRVVGGYNSKMEEIICIWFLYEVDGNCEVCVLVVTMMIEKNR